MKITILGSGTFFISTKRSAPSYLLEDGNKKILIDCGPGTLMRLSQVGVLPQELDYILITHFHADHTADLFPLIMNIRLLDFFKDKSLKKFPHIYGPAGVKKFLFDISKIYQLPSLKGWDRIKYSNYKKEQKLGKIKLTSASVKHVAFGVSANAYALNIKIGKTILAFSGDSARCKNIEAICKTADVFICDTSYPKGMSNQAHMDTSDIGKICQKSNVKKVILTHIYPQCENIDLVSEIKEKFKGKVLLAKDLMKVNL